MEVFVPSLESAISRPFTSFFTKCSDPTLIFVRLWEYLLSAKNIVPTVAQDFWRMRFKVEEDG
jgi:hypothetical protein